MMKNPPVLPAISQSSIFNSLLFAALSILLFKPIPVLAGVFAVTPVRIYMAPKDRAVAVTITNEGTDDVVLQADLNAWSQKTDGADELIPTEDLILSPPIIKLAPGARQVVRLALLKPADASRQLIYRMIMREVPEAVASRDKTIEVPIALALSLPVFITPPVAKRDVSCAVVQSTPKLLNVNCGNQGTAYAQIREIVLLRSEKVAANFEGGTYILPGAHKIISLNNRQFIAPGPAQLSVRFDDGKMQIFDVVLP